MGKFTDKQIELRQEYLKEMRKANQRLRELEKLAQNPNYENVLKFAYHVAERDVKTLNMMSANEKVRYKIPTNTNRLQSALKKVKHFNEDLSTTTKRDIDAYYIESTNTFNKYFGTNFTWQELKNFTDASNWNELKKVYGSEFLQTVIHTHQAKKGVDIPSHISKIIQNVKKVVDDEVINEVSNILEGSGLRFDLMDTATGKYFDYENDENNPFI